jgi:hypothetical protein
MLRDLLAPEPKGVDGLPRDPQAQRLAKVRRLVSSPAHARCEGTPAVRR